MSAPTPTDARSHSADQVLVVDVGNTHTVLGVYRGDTLAGHWRIETREGRTDDEYGLLLRELLGTGGAAPESIRGAILACVVPPTQSALVSALTRYVGEAPLVVGPGIKSGMKIRTDNPHEVGADRIVNAVAAFAAHARSGEGLIVVDFGTATTFDCVAPDGAYLGGAIAPGIGISLDALFTHAAKLPRVQIERPARAVGRNTITSMQSGVYWGYVGLVEGLVQRMRDELDFPVRVIATGGFAPLIGENSEAVEIVDEGLTLAGLKLLYDRNA